MIRRRLKEQRQLPPPRKLYLWANCKACGQPAIMRLSDYAEWCLAPGCERLTYRDFVGVYLSAPTLPDRE